MKKLLVATICFFSAQAFATNEAIPKDRIITELSIYDDSVVVKFSPSYANSLNCTASSQDTIQLDYDDSTGKNEGLLSALLAAASANKPVGFGISDNSCAGQYPRIYRVDVQS